MAAPPGSRRPNGVEPFHGLGRWQLFGAQFSGAATHAMTDVKSHLGNEPKRQINLSRHPRNTMIPHEPSSANDKLDCHWDSLRQTDNSAAWK